VLIGLIGCTKSKAAYRAPARNLYTPSALFRGALRPDAEERDPGRANAWVRQVVADLVASHGPSHKGMTFDFHTGAPYRHPLEALLRAAAATCASPVDADPVSLLRP